MKRLPAIMLAAALAAALQAQDKKQEAEAVRKLGMAQYAISRLYVDSADPAKTAEAAIRGMLSCLDPHSTYTDAAETKAVNEPLEGNFDGIGVQFNILDDTLLVIQTVDKGPSQKAGMLAGDRIVSVNDTAIAGVKMPRAEIMRRIRGKKGTTARLRVRRAGVDGELAFDIVRDRIPLHTLDAAYMIAPKVGYVRFGSFGRTTHGEVRDAVARLQGEGAESMIIDLRGNSGGFLEPAIEIANEFLEKGDMIVYTQGRAVPKTEYRAHGGGIFTRGETAVLIDEFTASAAEILAGALQDQDRADIVGVRSFGKGFVQQPVGLPDGSMIRLTVSRYYTPAGRCIQKPYKPGENEAYNLDVLNRMRNGELMHADSIPRNDSLRFRTLRKRRAVYGGGGIVPDHFVPLDTTVYTGLYRSLSRKNLLLPAVLKYNDAHREELKAAYPSFGKFKKSYSCPSELIDSVLEEGEKAGIRTEDGGELRRTRALIAKVLKAVTARDIWDMTQYFEIMNEGDATIGKALEIIKERRAAP